MRWSLIVLGLVLAVPAFAETGDPSAGVPTRAVPCATEPLQTLHAVGSDPVVCWDGGCMKLDMQNGATPHPEPASQPTWLAPVPEVRADQVCIRGTCAKLGKRLAAAVAAYEKDRDPAHGPPQLGATSDLKAVAVKDVAWNVQADRPLEFPVPAHYRAGGEKPKVIEVLPAGDLLVLWWSTCAGPCTRFSITDSSGRPRGQEGEGGGGVFQLDAQRFVVYGEYGSAAIFDLGTARPRGLLPALVPRDPLSETFIRQDDQTILAWYSRGQGIEVARITAYPDGTPPSVSETQYLPRCPFLQ